MVRHEDEGVVLLGQLVERHVRHRRAMDVEGLVGQFLDALHEFGFALVRRQAAQVDHGQRKLHLPRGVPAPAW